MRKHLTILIIATTLAHFACTRQHEGDANAKDCDAAMEVYCQYADNENLTVAYLGDFTIHGKDIDAVMLQAKDENEWEKLRKDFDIKPVEDSLDANQGAGMCPDDSDKVSVGIGIETNFLEILGKDSITSREQITEEDVRKVSGYIAKQLRDILANFQDTDSVMPGAAIVIGEGSVAYNTDSVNYDQYIDLVSEAITSTLLEEYFQKHDSIGSDASSPKEDSILNSAIGHGHSGYVTAADYKNQAVWLFFYDNYEECNVILTHIKEDIIINK